MVDNNASLKNETSENRRKLGFSSFSQEYAVGEEEVVEEDADERVYSVESY